MNISVATATFYYRPFQEALEIISKAGFKFIELDLYWQGGRFEIAQHLKHFSYNKLIKLVRNYGLNITSVHEGGGLIINNECINPNLETFIGELQDPPNCIVFHTPHIEGDQDAKWMRKFLKKYENTLKSYQEKCEIVTIENMPNFDDYFCPINTPEDLNLFSESNNLGITLDTTHFTENGVNVNVAARVLKNQIRTLHISDYSDKKSHVFIGDGNIKWEELFSELNYPKIHTITLECSMATPELSDMKMDKKQLISRLKLARERLEDLLQI